MPSPRILILGGNRYNVAGIVAAREAGFVTIVADRSPDAPGLRAADIGLAVDICDHDSLMSAVRRCGTVDGVVSMAEAGVRSAARLARTLGLPGISEACAASATSKAAMRQSWAHLGSHTVEFGVARTVDQASDIIRRVGGFPVVFKPDRSLGGSRGVTRVTDPRGIHVAFQLAKSAGLSDTAVIIERFVKGSEHSVEVLIWKGQASVLCISQKVKSQYPYRVDVRVDYPADLTAINETAIAEMCCRGVLALGLTQGVAHVECVWSRDGPVLLELGARCGGGHTPQIAQYVTGVNEFVEACHMSCAIPPSVQAPRVKRGAAYRFLSFPPGRLASVLLPDSIRHHPNVLDADVMLQPGDHVEPLRSAADRAGFVVAIGETRQSAAELAEWACTQVSVSYVDGSVATACRLSESEPLVAASRG